MAVVWRLGSATVAEVLAELRSDLAYTTVLTVLRSLEAKGAVRHEQEGRAYRYYPKIQPAKVADRSLRRLLEKLYQGSRELLITRLVSDKDISPQELRRIRRLLDARLKELQE